MYIPILKNRTIELSVIKELINDGLSDHTIPLFEIIQAKSRSNSNKTFVDELEDIFSKANHSFFLDIPKLNITTATAISVQDFMTKVNRQSSFVTQQIESCKNINGIIPVLSYSKNESITSKKMNDELGILHQTFDKVALRLTPVQFNEIKDFSTLVLSQGDYFLLDIDENGHTNPVFKNIYTQIHNLKTRLSIITVIVNSNRSQSLMNKNIIDGEPIQEIDNSLLEMYSLPKYKFDGFGDYACVTNILPTSGGSISPAGIYYSVENNYFVGFRGQTRSLDEFKNHIVPAIMKSSYWAEFDDDHHKHCPGCSKIQEIADGKNTGKSQGVWKGITMGHYIYTIDRHNI